MKERDFNTEYRRRVTRFIYNLYTRCLMDSNFRIKHMMQSHKIGGSVYDTLRRLGYVESRGHTKSTTYHWIGEAPTPAMVDQVLEGARDIHRNTWIDRKVSGTKKIKVLQGPPVNNAAYLVTGGGDHFAHAQALPVMTANGDGGNDVIAQQLWRRDESEVDRSVFKTEKNVQKLIEMVAVLVGKVNALQAEIESLKSGIKVV